MSDVDALAAYRRLAQRLDALPEGFPPTTSGVELRLLAKLLTPEEAALVAELRLTLETVPELAERLLLEVKTLRAQLKSLARRGLIAVGRAEAGLGYGLLPFVVGIYEMQVAAIDAELAALFEAYYCETRGQMAAQQPPVHRVIPISESVRADLDVRPYESAAAIIETAQAWGVTDCICRKQKALIGEPCPHPLDVCMVLSESSGAFDASPTVRALTRAEALATLRRAAEAGLVHSVSNNQRGLWYICNCCTCACGLLRGMVDFGLRNVIAPSAYIIQVDEPACIACGACAERCPFDALTVADVARVDALRCVGCGACTLACPTGALALMARAADASVAPPATLDDWRATRAAARGLDFTEAR